VSAFVSFCIEFLAHGWIDRDAGLYLLHVSRCVHLQPKVVQIG
jgi:hypothetical protein